MNSSTAKLLRSAAEHEVREWYGKVYLPSNVRFTGIHGVIHCLCRFVEKLVMPPPGITHVDAPTSDEVERAVKEALAEHLAQEIQT